MAKRKTTKRKRSTSTTMKRKMARVRSFKKNGGKKIVAKRRKKKVRTKTRTVTRRVTRTVSRNPVHRKYRRKRSYRRNPRLPRTVKGFGNQIFNGVIDAGEVVLGKSVARMIPQMIGIPSGGPMGLITQVVVAIGVGFLGSQMISSNAGKMMLAGALAAPVEDMIRQANIPFISQALGENNNDVFIEGVGSYPQLGAYPQTMGDQGYYAVGENEEEEALMMQ